MHETGDLVVGIYGWMKSRWDALSFLNREFLGNANLGLVCLHVDADWFHFGVSFFIGIPAYDKLFPYIKSY